MPESISGWTNSSVVQANCIMSDLKSKLQEIIKGEVVTDSVTLNKFSRDASLFEISPEVVVKPQDSEDIKNLVSFVSKQKKNSPGLSLTARSGGTCMSGGPLNESIIVDVNAHLNKLQSVGRLGAVAQPGMFYRDFERRTLKHGLLMPSYPASRSICTIGGMVANNSGGEKSLIYGQTKDYVRGLKVVLADGNEYKIVPVSGTALKKKLALKTFEGEVYRKIFKLVTENESLLQQSKPTTSKNSAGYFLWDIWDGKTLNLCKLFAGSQGTLGLITEIDFKMVKPKPFASMLVIFMDDLKALGKVIESVLKYSPESFESYDEHTFSLAMKYLPQLIASMRGGFVSWAWQFLPEIKLVLTGGLPKLVLIAEFTGSTAGQARSLAVECQKDLTEQFGLRVHLTKNKKERLKYWVMRRESFSLLRKHSGGRATAPFIDDIIVHPNDLPEFLPRLDKIFSKYPDLIYTVAGHMGNANFHIIPLMKIGDPEQRKIVPKLAKEVYRLVLEYKGSLTAEHNDGLIRTPFLKDMFGEKVVELFAKTKQIFDPQNIFNPGKKVGHLTRNWQDLVKRT